MKIGQETPVIVSGGASGLGAAVAKLLADAGAPVAIFDLNAELGGEQAAQIGAKFFSVDVTDSAAVASGLVDARAAQGQERICVNCAGIAPAKRTITRDGPHDPASFARAISINLIGTFNVASQSAAGMAAATPLDTDNEHGVIINTASVAAFDGQIGQIAYAASKAGVAGMTLPMARDLASAGIRIMAIAPGIFGTPMVTAMPQEVQDALAARIPFPSRLGAPEEFAALVKHIVENAMLNGETIRLDGAIRMPPK